MVIWKLKIQGCWILSAMHSNSPHEKLEIQITTTALIAYGEKQNLQKTERTLSLLFHRSDVGK